MFMEESACVALWCLEMANELQKLMATRPGPGDVVIDCGANIGEVTEFFRRHGSTVYAFEPNIYAFQVLKDRFAGASAITCIQKGVSSPQQSGVGKLFLYDQLKYSTCCSINSDKCNVDIENYLHVELLDLCKFIENLGMPIKVLKIDIEGAEIELLNALIDQGLTESIEYIFVETHEKKIPSLRKPLELLKEKIRDRNITNIDLTWR